MIGDVHSISNSYGSLRSIFNVANMMSKEGNLYFLRDTAHNLDSSCYPRLNIVTLGVTLAW